MHCQGEILKIIAKNRKAFRDFELFDRFEAGIVLIGSEVKSIRAGRVSLKDAYAKVKNGEVWLYGMHISPYEKAGIFIPDPKRRRKLLLHRREIMKLKSRTEERGLTIVPLEIYFKRGLVKVKIALAKGRREYQKKRYLLQKQQERDKERELKEYFKKKG
ncbi:SsrA-binding protein [bacterium]|nr:MAG: SsrA-binding protein [bacterium]